MTTRRGISRFAYVTPARQVLLIALAVLATVFVVRAGTADGSSHGGGARRPHSARRNSMPQNPFTTAAMRAYLATRSGDISAALYDVKTGKTYLYRPGVAEQTASIVKVDILETLLHEAELEHRSLTANEQAVATGMIEESDNDDATSLWDEVGGSSAVAAYDRLAGLTDTAPNTDGYWGETTTTALDQIRLLQHLVLANTLLDSASRSYELSLMEHVIPFDYWGVPNGVPKGVTVAVKNGWVPIVDGNWQINSVGFVDGHGEEYLLAILTNGNAEEDYGIATTGGIAAIVWKSMAP